MGRPRLPITADEISVEIARLAKQTQAQMRELEERRRSAEARENQQRGQLISVYLKGPGGDHLRGALRALVSTEHRALFGIVDASETS